MRRLYIEQLRKRTDLAQLPAEHSKKLASKCTKGLELMERIKPKLEDVYRAKAAIAAKQAAERDAAARKQQVRADARVNTIQQAEMEQLEKRLLALGAKPDELPSAGLPPPQAVAESAATAPVVDSPAVPAYSNLAAPPSDVNSNKNSAIAMSAAAAAAAAASVASVAATAATSPYPALSPSAIGDVFVPTAIPPTPQPPVLAPVSPPPGDPPAYQAPPSAPPMDSPVKQESIVYSTLPPVQSMPMPSAPPAVAAPPATAAAAVVASAPPPASATPQRAVASMGGAHIGNRPVILDGEILSDFMRLVHANTARGIETCGVLTGKLESSENDDGRFIVTHLILPRQKGTQNTCEMIDEDTLFDFQMKHDLMTLGWIHTHPTQSCFLSSVDLHTHLGYQLMLPEAIAIVMAPTDRRAQFGVFSLSEIGVDAIRNCQQKSFHVHRLPDADIYSNAAHVRWRQGRPQYRLVDFR
jgi:proteasome lid subunit RPN8/RPN11